MDLECEPLHNISQCHLLHVLVKLEKKYYKTYNYTNAPSFI